MKMSIVKIEIDTEAANRCPGAGLAGASSSLLTATGKTALGVVSSVDKPSFYEKFLQGIKIQNPNVRPRLEKVKVGYKRGPQHQPPQHEPLKTTIGNNFNNNDLLVTFGGLVAYEAANDAGLQGYISLVGNVPAVLHDYCWGGVSLECIATNELRFNYLMEKLVPKSNIYLFYNPNSEMSVSGEEIQDWNRLTAPNSGQVFPGGVNAQGDNDSNAYGPNFDGIETNGNIQALVVSADPFFGQTKDPLITAANAWLRRGVGGPPRFICYPSRGFATGTQLATRSILYGPSMEDAYFLMGQVAVNALVLGKQGMLRLTSQPPLDIP
jgi:hypothetical protein